jgi:hypothetical protein
VDPESSINKIIQIDNPLATQPEEKRPLTRSMYSWKNNIKADL